MLFFRRNCSHPGQTPRPRLDLLFLATLSGLMFSQSALASNIAVASPINGTLVSSSIWVRAHDVGCDGLRPHAFGCSIDNSRTISWGVVNVGL
jgi:hypothetical protein